MSYNHVYLFILLYNTSFTNCTTKAVFELNHFQLDTAIVVILYLHNMQLFLGLNVFAQALLYLKMR